MTRQQIERRLDELACEYDDTHDRKITEELYELARKLAKMPKESVD